ncbi:MAG TPA: hypothetical protein VMT63_13145 [Bacteroidales bacterium]|nr:hypothetical protein [Bacteroidales bacterium]
MSKKGLIVLLFFLLSGAAVLTWFVQTNGKGVITDPCSAIPSDASVILESADLPDFIISATEGNRIFSLLERVKGTGLFRDRLKSIKSIICSKEGREIFDRNSSVISFHYDSLGSFIPLFSMNLMQKSSFRKLVETLHSKGIRNLQEINAHGVRIIPFLLKSASSSDTLYLAFRSGLAICSPSLGLLNRSVSLRSKLSDIRSVPGFLRVTAAAGRKEDKIYIIFPNLARAVRSVTSEKDPGAGERFARLAGCAGADIHFRDDGLVLSGYSEFSDSTDILYKYRHSESARLTSYGMLPSDVQMFSTVLLNGRRADTAGLKTSEDETGYFAKKLLPYLGDEITRAVLDRGIDKKALGNVTVYKLSNRQMAEEVLSENLSSWAEKNRPGKGDYIQYFQPDDQTRIPVYSTPFRNLRKYYLETYSGSEPDSLFAFSDNYLISGNSFAAIKRVLYNNLLNKTLANDLSYRDFESTLPSRAEYYLYFQPSGIVDFLRSFINDEVIDAMEANLPQLKKIQAAGFQFAASNGMIYNTLSVKLGDTSRTASGAEWETLLDTLASIKPFFFTNHNTGAREIFIQDHRNNVYLINSAGRVLWKVSPGEKIAGNVYMIDFFNNGKYQLLFSGTNNLYLLDRNGNYVEHFPVRLRSAATAPAALFDYDGTGEFRILVPGEDRYIYAYDKSGNTVRGWKPFRTGGTVRSEIKFFRISGKDYLVASDDQNVYFLDRTGNQRLRLREPVLKATKSEIRLDNNGYPGIVFTSPEGIVTKISFDGNVTKSEIRKFSVDHSFDFFDVDGDGFGEYVFIDKGILYLYNRNRVLIFERDFGSADLEGPVFFIFSGQERRIGVTDVSRKLIYLIDKRGNNAEGFPLKGASIFSIGKLSEKGDFRLIVGGEDNYLYNYRLETGNQIPGNGKN